VLGGGGKRGKKGERGGGFLGGGGSVRKHRRTSVALSKTNEMKRVGGICKKERLLKDSLLSFYDGREVKEIQEDKK